MNDRGCGGRTISSSALLLECGQCSIWEHEETFMICTATCHQVTMKTRQRPLMASTVSTHTFVILEVQCVLLVCDNLLHVDDALVVELP